MKVQIKKNSEKIYKVTALIIFMLYAVIGLFIYDDYGCGPDEGIERQTTLVNFKYVVRKFHIPVSGETEAFLGYLPELQEYRDRYYGAALHFPMVLIESLFDFKLEPVQFYGMRHFFTFLNYYVGTICFYFLLKDRFGYEKYAIAGILMMIIYPRFFAESFYNNKDLVFTAWYIICDFLMARWFRKKTIYCSVLLAFALAVTCNTRLNGIVFIPIFLLLYLCDCIRSRKIVHFSAFMLTLILPFLFFYLITPNFWEAPFRTLAETIQFNLHHPNHTAEGNLFRGVLVDASHVYSYLPVWITITTPVVYLVLSLAGTALYSADMLRTFYRKELSKINNTDLIIFISGYGALAFIILAHVTIYNGWRHCYFAYPCFVYFAVYILFRLSGTRLHIMKAVTFAVLSVSMIYNAYWLIKNHPFQFAYFSPIARKYTSRFSGDYWGISSRAMLEQIMDDKYGWMLTVNHAYSPSGSINRGMLPKEKQEMLQLTTDDIPEPNYYIVTRGDRAGVDIVPNGFEKVYSIFVDNDEIGAVFKDTKLIYIEDYLDDQNK